MNACHQTTPMPPPPPQSRVWVPNAALYDNGALGTMRAVQRCAAEAPEHAPHPAPCPERRCIGSGTGSSAMRPGALVQRLSIGWPALRAVVWPVPWDGARSCTDLWREGVDGGLGSVVRAVGMAVGGQCPAGTKRLGGQCPAGTKRLGGNVRRVQGGWGAMSGGYKAVGGRLGGGQERLAGVAITPKWQRGGGGQALQAQPSAQWLSAASRGGGQKISQQKKYSNTRNIFVGKGFWWRGGGAGEASRPVSPVSLCSRCSSQQRRVRSWVERLSESIACPCCSGQGVGSLRCCVLRVWH